VPAKAKKRKQTVGRQWCDRTSGPSKLVSCERAAVQNKTYRASEISSGKRSIDRGARIVSEGLN